MEKKCCFSATTEILHSWLKFPFFRTDECGATIYIISVIKKELFKDPGKPPRYILKIKLLKLYWVDHFRSGNSFCNACLKHFKRLALGYRPPERVAKFFRDSLAAQFEGEHVSRN